MTPLVAAAWSGDRNAALVKLLIEHGAAVNVKTGDTFEVVKNGPIQLGHLTPLQVACGMANYEAVEALVKAGAGSARLFVRAGSVAIKFERAPSPAREL